MGLHQKQKVIYEHGGSPLHGTYTRKFFERIAYQEGFQTNRTRFIFSCKTESLENSLISTSTAVPIISFVTGLVGMRSTSCCLKKRSRANQATKYFGHQWLNSMSLLKKPSTYVIGGGPPCVPIWLRIAVITSSIFSVKSCISWFILPPAIWTIFWTLRKQTISVRTKWNNYHRSQSRRLLTEWQIVELIQRTD